MLEEFVDSVLIIDDNEEEIKNLRQALEEKDILVKYLNPDDCLNRIKSRRLIFMDLYLDKTAGNSIPAHISKIRRILKIIITNVNTSYGLVIWTNHIDDVEELKNRIQNDTEYLKPLFIVGLDKTKYSKKSFDNVLNDLNEILSQSIAANFFINWSNLIRKGRDVAISSIFELIPDYQKQDKNLEFLLFKMAQNYTGIPFDKIDDGYPLSIDAIKAFNDLLISEINSSAFSIDIFQDKNKISFKKNESNIVQPSARINNVGDEILDLYAKINSKLLLDYVNIQQDRIIPGNVYKIVNGDSKLKHRDLPDNAIPIVIEMTPSCDFSNSNSFYPRVLSGYITDLNISNRPNKDKFYKELWPIKLEGKDKPQIIIFDFSVLGFVDKSDLKDTNKYKLLFRVKDKLFADILQKMSAYTARLGLSIIR